MARRQERNPSLNVIQPRHRGNEPPNTDVTRDTPEEIRIGEALARRKAWDLHQEVYPSKTSFQKGKKDFFCEGARGATPAGRKTARLIPAKGLYQGRRTFIVDSGASFHLIKRAHLTREEKKTLRKLVPAIPLQTANGNRGHQLS